MPNNNKRVSNVRLSIDDDDSDNDVDGVGRVDTENGDVKCVR